MSDMPRVRTHPLIPEGKAIICRPDDPMLAELFDANGNPVMPERAREQAAPWFEIAEEATSILRVSSEGIDEPRASVTLSGVEPSEGAD